MTPEELRDTGSEIILGNTFHLMLRPGVDVIDRFGGLHEFMHLYRQPGMRRRHESHCLY